MSKNKAPKHFIVFKIIGLLGAVAAVIGIVLAIKGFGNFEDNSFMIGGFLTTFGIFAAGVGFAFGFAPQITKTSIKTAKYLQQENKDDLAELMNTSAEIASGAATALTAAVKEGLQQETKFCKHCGAKIDADSKFCSQCGKEQ